MSPFDVLPVWSQYGVLGLSLAFNVFIIVEWFRGNITTRKQLDQVQKMADTFKDAWSSDQEVKANQAQQIAETSDAMKAFTHAFNSLPSVSPGDKDA